MIYRFFEIDSDGRIAVTDYQSSSYIEARGYAKVGVLEDKQMHPKLLGHPIFAGLNGPCGPFDGGVCYETWPACERLSS